LVKLYIRINYKQKSENKMKAKCVNGCFEREVPKKVEKKVKKDEHFLICTFCFGRVILEE